MDANLAIDLIELIIAPDKLNEVQRQLVRGTLAGISYKQIGTSLATGDKTFKESYIKGEGSALWQRLGAKLGREVTKKNLESVLLWYESQQSAGSSGGRSAGDYDWERVADGSSFYGRGAEIDRLQGWIGGGCQLLVVLGMGGMGKTSLVSRVADLEIDGFERRIWRSLEQQPKLELLLRDLLRTLDIATIRPAAATIDSTIEAITDYMQRHRVLLILDNLDSLFQKQVKVGEYRSGYENYTLFFQALATTNHQSCAIVTSREQPPSLGLLAVTHAQAVRTLILDGLCLDSSTELVTEYGLPPLPIDLWRELHRHYSGNPLALKIATVGALDYTGGDLLAAMPKLMPQLRRGEMPFDDIRDLVQRQFNRISIAEQQVLYWLAIVREPVMISTLAADLIPGALSPEFPLPLALQSLLKRCMAIQQDGKWTALPVTIEAVSQRLVAEIALELSQSPIPVDARDLQQRYRMLNRYSLMQAMARNYVRQQQSEAIIEPIVDRLVAAWGSAANLTAHLRQVLAAWQQLEPIPAGYLAGNILNFLVKLDPEREITNLDCALLPIWQADLVDVTLRQVSFAGGSFDRVAFTQTFGAITAIVLSPDGERFATGDSYGTIYLWQFADRQRSIGYTGHLNWVRSIAFSPDGLLMASASEDRTVKLWNVETGSCLATLRSPRHTLRGVRFTPDGSQVMMGCDDAIVRFCDLRSILDGDDDLEVDTYCIRQFVGHTGWVFQIVPSPDGKIYASASNDSTVRLWDAETGECLHVLAHSFWVARVVFSPDGDRLLTSGFGAEIGIWDVASGDRLGTIDSHQGWVWSIGYSPDGKTIASAGEDGTIRLWTAQGKLQYTIAAHQNRIWTVAFTTDGQQLISGGEDRTIKFWHLRSGDCTHTLKGYINSIKSIALLPDDNRLIAGYHDRSVRIWDFNAMGDALRPLPVATLAPLSEAIESLCSSRDGKYLAASTSDGEIQLWDARDFTRLWAIESGAQGKYALAFSLDGKYLVGGGFDRTLKIWDVATGAPVATISGHQHRIHHVAVCPQTGIIATGSEDTTIKIWDLDTRTCLQTIDHPQRQIFTHLSFSADGRYLASTSLSSQISIWRTTNWTCNRVLNGHQGWCLSTVFAADSQLLYSSSCDRTIRVWDLDTGENIHTYRGHANWVWTVALATDGKFLYSAGEDESILIWDLERCALDRSLTIDRPYEGTNISSVAGLLIGQKANLKMLGAIEL